MPAVQTIGASPKKIAATVASVLAPIACAFILKTFGLKIDVDTATAIIGLGVTGLFTYGAAHFAKPGKVYVDQTLYPDAFSGPNPPAKVAPTVPEAVPEKKPKPRRKPAKKS